MRRRRRQESFLTDPTWVLRDQRVWLRKAACRFRTRCGCVELCAALRAWRRGCLLGTARVFVAALLCAESLSPAVTVGTLRDTRNLLRRSLRADKRQWIADLARQAVSCPTRDIVTRLRPLLQPKKRQQSFSRGLPAVRLEDGTLAVTDTQALDRWVRHFASNEGGTRCEPLDLEQAARASAASSSHDPFPLAIGKNSFALPA